MTGRADIVVIGAGPYGLAGAAHLQSAGRDVRIFGEPMGFWKRQMPTGMVLRSGWDASHIADPADELTLDRFQEAVGRTLPVPVTLEDFVAYGDWFREQAGLDVDARRVSSVDRSADGLSVRMEDGEELLAKRVVVATGLADFPWWPTEFRELPGELVSHSSDHRDFSALGGKNVAVVGAGQSALESAALLQEAGASVEVLARERRIYWLTPGELVIRHPHMRRLLYPRSEVGPPGLNWIVAVPPLFRALPPGLQAKVARRVLRPAGADWLVSRLTDVRISTGTTVVGTHVDDGRLRLTLDDGRTLTADHLLLATGYRVEIGRLPILSAGLRATLDHGPLLLARGFESRVPGLHFVGAAASHSFGPLMRFVAGTRYAGRELAAGLAR